MLKVALPIKARPVPLFSAIGSGCSITSLILAGCSMNSPSDLRAKAAEQIKGNNLAGSREESLKKTAADQEQSNGSNDVAVSSNSIHALGDLI
jgi:hypothetical protein